MAIEILIVDDNADIRNILNELILDAGYKTRIAANYNQALSEIDKKIPDVAILDVKLDKGDKDGIDLLRKIKKITDLVPVIMISGHGDLETAVESIKKGAFDYISKPPDLNRLLHTIRIGLDRNNLVVQNKVLRKKVSKKYEMVGNSPELQKIHEMIERVAPTDARVLIIGANGSGKELIAHAIHQKSERNVHFTKIKLAI